MFDVRVVSDNPMLGSITFTSGDHASLSLQPETKVVTARRCILTKMSQ
uniref:(California timema) hypothetical protein n=1 Tax=Timema californicum TaxID=61474 RepID=A0A7R9JHX6_TIMCA|nr:unnamed protein product [Timema californicum]